MIYIASPFSIYHPSLRPDAYLAVRAYTAQCLIDGEVVFSPITYTYEMATHYSMPHSHEFWWNLNRRMLELSSEVRVFQLPLWDSSSGVTLEIKWAIDNNVRVTYINPERTYEDNQHSGLGQLNLPFPE